MNRHSIKISLKGRVVMKIEATKQTILFFIGNMLTSNKLAIIGHRNVLLVIKYYYIYKATVIIFILSDLYLLSNFYIIYKF